MGLDVSVSLIVGVPVSTVATITETSETLPTTDNLGRPTGVEVELKRAFLTLPNGKQYEIGSNERRLTDLYSLSRSSVEYRPPKELYDYWHYPDGENVIKDTVFGVIVENAFKSGDYGRFEGPVGAPMDAVVKASMEARAWLATIGYTGELFVVAMPTYSY